MEPAACAAAAIAAMAATNARKHFLAAAAVEPPPKWHFEAVEKILKARIAKEAEMEAKLEALALKGTEQVASVLRDVKRKVAKLEEHRDKKRRREQKEKEERMKMVDEEED